MTVIGWFLLSMA